MIFRLLAAAALAACGCGTSHADSIADNATLTTYRTPSSTTGISIGSGTVAACPTTPARTTGGTTTLSVAASRSTGVAPLSVFFDATGTTSTATTRPFHDVELRWSFGESAGPGVTSWTQGSRAGTSSRNTASGPVAAHVYETPGVYTVQVTDAARAVSYHCQITVQSPDAVFAGSQTACFSTTGNFTGCPAGAIHTTTSDFAVVKNTPTSTNTIRRLLLRRGETWTTGASAAFAIQGPGLIGAFGTGARPVIRTITGFPATAVISFSGPYTPTMKDWRLMDITIDGTTTAHTRVWAVGAMGGIDQLTLLRVNPNSVSLGILFEDTLLDHWNVDPNPIVHGHHVWDQFSVVDMDVTNMPAGTPGVPDTYSYGTYFSGERVFYAGNSIDGRGTSTTGVSHNARFPYVAKAVISNNTLQRPGPAEHNIKLHSAAWGSTGVSGTQGIGGGYSRWIVISDNLFTSSYNAWQVTLGPQDDVNDDRVKDVILERNMHRSGYTAQWGQVIWATEVTSRNNIFETSGSIYHGGIWVARRSPTTLPADRVRVYNNTMHSGDAANNFMAVKLDPSVTNVVVKNNLAFAPLDTYHMMIVGTGSASAPLVASNNSSLLALDPLFVGPFSVASGFKLRVGSYALNGGAPSPGAPPVYSDFFRIDRPIGVPADLGAATH